MSSGSLEVIDHLNRGSFSGEETAKDRSHGGGRKWAQEVH